MRKIITTNWMRPIPKEMGFNTMQCILYNLSCGRTKIVLGKNYYSKNENKKNRLGTYKEVSHAIHMLYNQYAINKNLGKSGNASDITKGDKFDEVYRERMASIKGAQITPANIERYKMAAKSVNTTLARKAVKYIWGVTYMAKPGSPAFIMDDRVGAVRAKHRKPKKTGIVKAGRLYDGGLSLQGLRRDLRKWVIMVHDGKSYNDLVEADFSALHYNLLYAKTGQLTCPGDPYGMVIDALKLTGGQWRDELKQLFVTIANTNGKVQCRVSIERQLKEISKTTPVYFTALELMKSAEIVHKPISGHFYKPNWFQLHHDDSELLLAIVDKLSLEQIPLCPLHDAVIVPAEYGTRACDIMAEESKKMFGVSLPTKLKPIGSVPVRSED